MPRIQHVAVATQDVEGTVKFYTEGLGLQIVGKVNSPLAEGYYLSDGYINLAVLKYKNDEVATTEGAPRHTGVHHIGFAVDDMDKAQADIIGAGAKPHLEQQMAASQRPAGSKNVEYKFTGPDGVTLDLSLSGWATTPD